MTPEGRIKAHLYKRVKHFGGEVRKVRWEGRRNAPDTRVMLPRLRFWAELKRNGKKAEAAQKREHDKMRHYGEKVEVLNSCEEIDELLYIYGYSERYTSKGENK